MSPRVAKSHTPLPDTNGICKVCGWECTSDRPDPETPAPQAGDLLSEDYLDTMHPGRRVYDKDGDVWVRRPDGLWQLTQAKVSTPTLAYIFQPIRLAEEDG